MKTYILKKNCLRSRTLPTHNDDNLYTSLNGPILRKECWWRWGEFTLEISGTEEEIDVFLNEKGFGTLEEYSNIRALVWIAAMMKMKINMKMRMKIVVH